MENKFNIGRKVLSDSEIEKHKDFTALYRSYRTTTRPIFKTTRFIAGLSVAAAAIIIFVLYFSFFRNSSVPDSLNEPEGVQLAVDSKLLPVKVSPPLAGFEKPRQTFKMKGNRGGKFKTPSGTEIQVPANAFVDEQGNNISGEMEIRYCEFNNPLEFFLSGIPMQQVTGGQVYQTESSGMFEILAFQHNQSLKLNKNKSIDVEMTSAFPGDYNCYYLDAAAQQWKDQGKSTLMASSNMEIAADRKSVSADSSGLPVMPRKADKKKFVFNIKVDVSSFPELSVYNGLLFEVNEANNRFDERFYDYNWDRAVLRASETPSNYDLTLYMRDTSVTIRVYPVFNSGRNYDLAVKLYNEKKQAWIAQHKENEAKNVASKPSGKSESIEMMRQQNNAAISFNKMKILGKRHVGVAALGIYLCGKKIRSGETRKVKPVITDQNGKILKNATMYLSERDCNTLACFGKSEVISFNSTTKNLFWVVTPDGKIGVLSPESFASLCGESQTPEFKMEFLDPKTALAVLGKALQI